jgi:hypothetical protein
MKSPKKKSEIELEPDAWQRFERAIDVVARSPPQHRTAKKKQSGTKKAKKKSRS